MDTNSNICSVANEIYNFSLNTFNEIKNFIPIYIKKKFNYIEVDLFNEIKEKETELLTSNKKINSLDEERTKDKKTINELKEKLNSISSENCKIIDRLKKKIEKYKSKKIKLDNGDNDSKLCNICYDNFYDKKIKCCEVKHCYHCIKKLNFKCSVCGVNHSIFKYN